MEIIVVIFVLSMVLAVALPSFTGIGESRMKSEAKRIASILRYLNDSALSTKETLSMKIDFRDKSIGYNGPDGDKSESFETLHDIELQSKGKISQGDVIVFFGPAGAAESVRFNLRDEEQTLGVALNAMSGRVKVLENEK